MRETENISLIAFGFLDKDKPIDTDEVVTTLTSLLGIEYSQNTRPDEISGNYKWNIDSYEIELSYWNMDDEKYPGAGYINIWCK